MRLFHSRSMGKDLAPWPHVFLSETGTCSLQLGGHAAHSECKWSLTTGRRASGSWGQLAGSAITEVWSSSLAWLPGGQGLSLTL